MIKTPNPANNSWVEIDNHNLSVNVSNNQGEIMNVSFYWANNDSLIEKIEDVLNNTIAHANSSFNYTNYQNYSWYVTVNSTHYDNQSALWNFTGEAHIWDVDRSADITLTDLTSIATHYKETGDNHWIRQDTTSNGVISLSDLTYVTYHYGESY